MPNVDDDDDDDDDDDEDNQNEERKRAKRLLKKLLHTQNSFPYLISFCKPAIQFAFVDSNCL